MKKVLIFGKFDIIHPGHIFLIKQAKTRGKVTAVVESDKLIKKFKNYTPYQNEKIRLKNLQPFGLELFLRSSQDARQLIGIFSPDILCLGHDQELLQEMFSGWGSFQTEVLPPYQPQLFKSSRLAAILEDSQSSLYLLDKPKGEHSFKAVSILRQALQIKKVGFAGTLDPLASGLMILASGRATRLLDWFHILPKTYQADIVFGQRSNTYDLEGRVEINEKAKKFSCSDLEQTLKKFLGQQKQIVPAYSAKKIQGQKLHQLARAGKKIVRPATDIEIYDLKIKSFVYPKLELSISCSAGTYIRSLAHDLGEALGTGALLADLRRTAIGDFKIQDALPFAKVSPVSLAKSRINPAEAISRINQWAWEKNQ
ncbi:MAG: tRNA pseudouridine(55) synthase TruB [Patescibacteria group bacterium]|nr:tRNA pseudouridine(55) synthase TruB [Patescibacteria group bacterium]